MKKSKVKNKTLEKPVKRFLSGLGVLQQFRKKNLVASTRQRKIREALPTSELNTSLPLNLYNHELRKALLNIKAREKNIRMSANTRQLLNHLAKVQTLTERKNLEQQRRIRERRVIESSTDIMKTPYCFNKYQFNTTGVSSDNILNAPNSFKENPEDNILRPRAFNVLETRKTGYRLKL